MSDNNRQHERKSVLADAKLFLESGQATCTVQDISMGGAKIETTCDLEAKQNVDLHFDNFGDFSALVAWRRNNLSGLKFTGNQDAIGEMLVAMAMYS